MRIFIIGKSKKACIVSDYFASNEDFLVFNTCFNALGNFVDIPADNVCELLDFAIANEIDLTIVCDDELMELPFNAGFSENNLAILSPEPDSIRVVTSKATGKKFIYKNKIRTPKFAVFEKPQLAVEYVRENRLPLVIKPDRHYGMEGPFIAETFLSAKKYIENLFVTGNKRIIIEEYIFGKEVSFYVLTDGFNPVLIDTTKSYLDNIAVKGADIIDDDLKRRIFNNVIIPTITSLRSEGSEYVGILGFDFIVDLKQNFYLLEYNTFFKEIDTNIMLTGVDENWAELFMSAITGTLLDEHPVFKRKDIYLSSFRENNDILTVEASTKNLLREKIELEGFDKKELNEAIRIWKS